MRAYEFLTEDPALKSKVISALQKKPEEDPVFSYVYKVLVGEPLSGRIKRYIEARNDPNATAAMEVLDQIIPTLGDTKEVKAFLDKFKKPDFDFISIKNLCPADGMKSSADLTSIVSDPFAKKLFNELQNRVKGKKDAGPSEAALAIMSSSIMFAPSASKSDNAKGGDLIVNGVGRVEVKSGTGGRLVGAEKLDQQGMTTALGSFRPTKPPSNKSDQTDNSVPVEYQGIRPDYLSRTLPAEFPKEQFMRAACLAWFGEERPEIIKAAGTSSFGREWFNAMYRQYKEYAQFNGILFLTGDKYQYVIDGSQIPDSYIVNKGYVYYPKSRQTREMSPQVVPK